MKLSRVRKSTCHDAARTWKPDQPRLPAYLRTRLAHSCETLCPTCSDPSDNKKHAASMYVSAKPPTGLIRLVSERTKSLHVKKMGGGGMGSGNEPKVFQKCRRVKPEGVPDLEA